MATQSKESLTGLASAKSLASIPAGVRKAIIQAIGGAVYYWLDGSSPAADGSSGLLLANGASITVLNALEIRGFKGIQKTGDTSTLQVAYQA